MELNPKPISIQKGIPKRRRERGDGHTPRQKGIKPSRPTGSIKQLLMCHGLFHLEQIKQEEQACQMRGMLSKLSLLPGII